MQSRTTHSTRSFLFFGRVFYGTAKSCYPLSIFFFDYYTRDAAMRTTRALGRPGCASRQRSRLKAKIQTTSTPSKHTVDLIRHTLMMIIDRRKRQKMESTEHPYCRNLVERQTEVVKDHPVEQPACWLKNKELWG